MGGLIVGRAYHPHLGPSFVEQTDSKDHFRVRSIATGRSRYMHRDAIQWRR